MGCEWVKKLLHHENRDTKDCGEKNEKAATDNSN